HVRSTAHARTRSAIGDGLDTTTHRTPDPHGIGDCWRGGRVGGCGTRPGRRRGVVLVPSVGPGAAPHAAWFDDRGRRPGESAGRPAPGLACCVGLTVRGNEVLTPDRD